MSEPEHVASKSPSHLNKLFSIIGILGIGLVTLTDTAAVIGRHLNMSLIGSIEVVQLGIVLLASAAIAIATKESKHARIQIVLNRINHSHRRNLDILSNIATFLFLILLFSANTWILLETWLTHERSEILHLPYHWIRSLFSATLLITITLLLKNILRYSKK